MLRFLKKKQLSASRDIKIFNTTGQASLMPEKASYLFIKRHAFLKALQVMGFLLMVVWTVKNYIDML